MTIEILPARLANQIAAGEVVERPASVVKELIENSLDAGATHIHLDIEKGGSKRIRLIDNGTGIAKDELCLALSRHATSKIKNLADLESISSLGFRGEALASISSVAQLTLTSKPKNQATAWQACAQGRDMAVTVQPAAHPDGTTIDVQNLFFNTPARRKFLRTEKTEFAHIDEVIKRIALARFDVAFTLAHNGKIIRQYQALNDKAKYSKRVAKICGQKFIDHALTIDCQHDKLQLWGWVATPNFVRNKNDLTYSYVNGRMMRDKLINHAIRQAFSDKLPPDTYPAFVLFLSLDHHEVDVNVHPAKHEVRFQQGRYIHDFIYSVIHGALDNISENSPVELTTSAMNTQQETQAQEYITPLRAVNDSASATYQPSNCLPSNDKPSNNRPSNYKPTTQSTVVSPQAVQAYQHLMSTKAPSASEINSPTTKNEQIYQLLDVYQQTYALIKFDHQLRLLDLAKIAIEFEQTQLEQRWPTELVRQPLLLPLQIKLSAAQVLWLSSQPQNLHNAGIILLIKDKTTVQIQQFPACLRHQDVTFAFDHILTTLQALSEQHSLSTKHWCQALAQLAVAQEFDQQTARLLLEQIQSVQLTEFNQYLSLNSAVIDLTSVISKLNNRN